MTDRQDYEPPWNVVPAATAFATIANTYNRRH